MAGTTRLELATSCVTGMRSNQTELRSHTLMSFDNFYYKMLKKKLQYLSHIFVKNLAKKYFYVIYYLYANNK